MRLTLLSCLLGLMGWATQPGVGLAQDVRAQAERLERLGDVVRSQALLAKAAESNPKDAAAQQAYAQFLDRYHDPLRRTAYQRWLDAVNPADHAARAEITRRLALLDLIEGDQRAAAAHLAEYQAAGGRAAPEILSALRSEPPGEQLPSQSETEIPGPFPRI